MKKWIFLAAVLLVSSTLTFAQTTGKATGKTNPKTEKSEGGKKESKPKKEEAKAKQTPAQKTAEVVAKMKAACNLTAEQVTKIEAAYLEYYQKHEGLKKQKEVLSKTVYDDREGSLKKVRNAAIKGTLTAAQYKQWQTSKSKAENAKAKEGSKKESDEE